MYLVNGENKVDIDPSLSIYDYLLNPLRELGDLPSTLPVPSYVIEQYSKWLQVHDDLNELMGRDYDTSAEEAMPIVKLHEVAGAIAFLGGPEGWEAVVQLERHILLGETFPLLGCRSLHSGQ